jgi:hypothetical protein
MNPLASPLKDRNIAKLLCRFIVRAGFLKAAA